MISWTKLLTGKPQPNDRLRYSRQQNCAPRIIVWNATSRCNLHCRHCYFEAAHEQEHGELTYKEAKDFIKDLSGFNVPLLLFSGGEPLLRKDIFELGRFAGDEGIRTALSTNGTLITPALAKKIRDAGFSYVGISLDGAQDRNDEFRQNRGAYSAALAGLRYCRDIGLKVGVRFTLTAFNAQDLPHIFHLVESESIPRLCIYHLVYTGRGAGLREEDLSHQEKRKILELIRQRTIEFSETGLDIEVLTVDNYADGAWIYLELNKRDPKRAKMVLELLKAQGGDGSGSKIGAVDNLGNVYADQFWRRHLLGNVREVKFSDIWQDGDNEFLPALRNRKYLLKGRCQSCNFLQICNGNFRARAEAVFDDPWGEDPGCYLTDEEIFGNHLHPVDVNTAGMDMK